MIDRILAWFGYIPCREKLDELARLGLKVAEAEQRAVEAEAALSQPREFERVKYGPDAIARGQRWQAFYQEEGGLGDMITSLRQGYFEKVGTLKPGDVDSLTALAMADRIARELDAQVRNVIETGKLRENEQAHVGKVAAFRR